MSLTDVKNIYRLFFKKLTLADSPFFFIIFIMINTDAAGAYWMPLKEYNNIQLRDVFNIWSMVNSIFTIIILQVFERSVTIYKII